MISGSLLLARPRPTRERSPLLVLLAAAIGLLTVSCEKVPLLAPSSASITLTALATALPINGTTDLLVQVLEQAGTPPHSGTHVTFTTTLGSIQPPEAQTDINGRVVVKFLAGTSSGTATITASSGGAGSSGAASTTTSTGTTATDSRTVKIAIGAAAISRIQLFASPTTLPANGGSSQISAFAVDASSNPLPEVPVSFATTAGTLSSTLAVTDQSGIARVTLTTARTATVTGSGGSVVPPTTGTGTATPVSNQVTVNVNSGPSISFGPITPAAPMTGQIVVFPISITAPGTTGSPLRSLSVDFGDGGRVDASPGSSTSMTVQHVYLSPGVYAVTAIATDTNGDTGSTSTAVNVSRSLPPTVNVTVTPAPPLHASTPITFSVTGAVATAGAPANTFIQALSINFGDGTSFEFGNTTTGSVQHVYPVPGQYTVTARAIDSNGSVSQASTVVIIGP